jgi:hypothetical protein
LTCTTFNSHRRSKRLRVPQRFEFLAVRSGQLANWMQPMVDKTRAFAIDGGADAVAAVMSDHHDVLHFEYVGGELEHR